jgi:hypothetical protein
VPSAEDRFRAKVERRHGHDLWTGFIDDRGTGMVRINGRLLTVQRAAWEFAYGPLPDNARVNSCAGERACVRIAHLSVTIPDDRTGKRTGRRRPRGTGSKREVRAGVWQLAITEATTADGRPVRRFETIQGDETAADTALAELAGNVRRDLGDLRVRELIGRYLHANHQPASTPLERDLALLHTMIEPRLGDRLADTMTQTEFATALAAIYDRRGPKDARAVLGIVRDAYRWARQQQWTRRDPTAELTLRNLRSAHSTDTSI